MMIKSRYQIYFLLMDIAFVLCWLGVIVEFWNYLGYQDPTHLIWRIFSLFAGFFSLTIPIFLVFARFMRDQYIDDLLQKTASSMLKFIFTFYPVLLLCGAALYLSNSILPRNIYLIFYHSPVGAFLTYLSDAKAYEGVWSCWIMATIAFTTIFEWYRWRASK